VLHICRSLYLLRDFYGISLRIPFFSLLHLSFYDHSYFSLYCLPGTHTHTHVYEEDGWTYRHTLCSEHNRFFSLYTSFPHEINLLCVLSYFIFARLAVEYGFSRVFFFAQLLFYRILVGNSFLSARLVKWCTRFGVLARQVER
jgi:hypothetical protein